MTSDLDLAIIGSGPAGLSAAITAAKFGLNVEVFDENPKPGGQIYRSIEATSQADKSILNLLGTDYQAGLSLVEEFRASNVTYRPNTKVWSLTSDGELSVVGPNGAQELFAKRVIVSVGAMERPMPVPGWTLPGVMSAGSAQIQLKAARQVPDVPFVIAGSGPLLYLVAWQLMKANAPLKTVLDTTPWANYLKASRHFHGAIANFSQIKKGLKWIQELRGCGVMVVTNVTSLSIDGENSVEGVNWTKGYGKGKSLPCEMVLLHQGVVPNYHLAALVGCNVVWDDVQKCWKTEVDEWGATNQEKVCVAGDARIIGGAMVARQQGELAGIDAAYRLGSISRETRRSISRKALNEIRKQAGLRKFLDQLYLPPEWVTLPTDDVTVCRCEEVKASEIRAAAKQGAVGANQLKFYTRAGMGRCQGRMCGITSSIICAKKHDCDVNEVGFARVRPPIKPITIGEMAESQNETTES